MKSRFLAALFLAAAPCGGASSVPPDDFLALTPGKIEVVPSFAACSYYFRSPAPATRNFVVEFRRAGAVQWERAFDPVSDTPVGIWKGSLFDLAEDTTWQLRVRGADGGEIVPAVDFRTWSSQPPIARVVDLSTLAGAERGLVIADQGTPEGWIKYTAPRGWRLERVASAGDSQAAAIEFRRARCVILENVTIVGGSRHAVLVEESESIRILNCDIAGWGRVGVQQFTNTGARGKYADAKGDLINYDAGVAINRSARTVVERCYLHDPRHRANSWMFSHPAGPAAVYANQTGGGTVVRWNDFVGSDEHRWNDVIESSSNSAWDGGFSRDSDIAGNFLAFGNDDGVELEGGGMNVRFYRNKIEGTTCSISTGACILGPQFVYENLVTNPGDEAGLALWFFKNSHGNAQGGRRHFINNTLFGTYPGAYGGYGKPVGTGRIGFMRNNIFVCYPGRLPGDWARRDDWDGDVFWAGGKSDTADAFLAGIRLQNQEPHGLALDPGFAAAAQGDFHLAANSPLRGRALAVANLVAAGANPGALGDAAAEVPGRPLALTTAPRELDFAAPQQTARMQVSLSVPATAREPVEFEVRQNRVFTWFKVAPAAGRIAPGETLTLTVSVDPAALHGRPRFKGAFLVRTPSGLSRPVSVYAAAVDFHEDLRPAAAPNSVYLEAAALAGLAGSVKETNAPGVVGGRYAALAGGEREIRARFTLPRAGQYSLLARAAVNHDVLQKRAFTLAIDGATEPARVATSTDYQWNTGATHFRVIYLHALGALAAGEHTLVLRTTGGDFNLNELIITDHPAVFFIDHWQRKAP